LNEVDDGRQAAMKPSAAMPKLDIRFAAVAMRYARLRD
jgi:hypothetical protein